MLPDSPDVQAVVFGENGIIGGARPGFLLIDMSTIAPKTSMDVHAALTEKGASALDAPVSGGDKGAIAGTLSIMVGGSEDRSQPGDAALRGDGQDDRPHRRTGRRADRQGLQSGGGRDQLRAAVSEALLLAQRSGVDPEKVAKVLGGGLAASRVLEMRGQSMIERQFEPGFRVNLHRKDLGIALSAGKETGSPLPVTALVSQLYDSVAAAVAAHWITPR